MLPVVLGLAAFLYSKGQDSIYEAKATILVQYTGISTPLETANELASSQLATTYGRLLTSRDFLDQVPLKGVSVSATTGRDPPLINLRVRHTDPALAAEVGQLVAERFIDYAIERRLASIARLQTAAAAQGITNVEQLVAAQFTAVDTLSLLEPVRTPGGPVVPQTRRNTLVGVTLGLLVAAAGAMVLETLRDTVRFPEQLERRFGVPGLGASVGNQHKWDRLGPEKIIIMKSCVGLPEGLVVASSPF